MLVLVVGVLLSIDITIVVIYAAVEGYRGNIEATLVPNGEHPESIDGVCDCVHVGGKACSCVILRLTPLNPSRKIQLSRPSQLPTTERGSGCVLTSPISD